MDAGSALVPDWRYGAGSTLQQDMASISAAQVSGLWVAAHESRAGAVAQQACAPPAGVVPGDGDFAVMHVPYAAVAANDGDDSERASMRTVNRRVSLVSLVSLVMDKCSG